MNSGAGVEMRGSHGREWSWPSGEISLTHPGPGSPRRGRKTGTLEESAHTEDTPTVSSLGEETTFIHCTLYHDM